MKHLNKRFGISTGTCAAAAAKAAALGLCGRAAPPMVAVGLPPGGRLKVKVQRLARRPDGSSLGVVRKYAGKDKDVTDGVEVIARLTPIKGRGRIVFQAGAGVGVVRKPGLPVPVGEPAINPVPRAMIARAIREVTAQSLRVKISIPGGARLAASTFNPRLGISGGLSILGTTGLVKPRCRQAMRAALASALSVASASGIGAPVFVPGNIGWQAAFRHFKLAKEQVIEVGNEWEFVWQAAARFSFKNWLILGHPGKLAKFIAGAWHTHSAASAPALGPVRAVAAEIFKRHYSVKTETVEGFFDFFSPDKRSVLANELAKRISLCIESRYRKRMGCGGVAVFLCDMKGDELGQSGDFSAWPRKRI